MNVNNRSARQGGSAARHLEDAQRKLVETGTRNRLIHVNRTSKRSNTLNIINERSDDIFDILRVNGRRMKFLATEKDQMEEQEELFLVNGKEEPFDESRYRDDWLETSLGPDALQKRLLRIFSDAKTAEEELGVNILYLAMGFLTWFEDRSSSVARQAPLILLPVDLVRNERSSTLNIRAREDDIVTNLPLQQRLRDDFGISLPDIDDSEAWTPDQYFSRVAEVVSDQRRWEIDANGMQLGFFSFAKFLMLRDLDRKNWPDGALIHSELVQCLLTDGFSPEPPLFGPDDQLDARLDPADIIHVIDADASQTKVIEEVRAGRNAVVQGPPGTGKSQTITNIIAAAVHDGKSVLFMAEKMAALNVVHDRLVKVGLRDLCLELHSRNANKKAVYEELRRTLQAGRSVPGMPTEPSKLRAARDSLNRIADLLHTTLPGRDYSPFSSLAEIIGFFGRNIPPPILKGNDFDKLNNLNRRHIADLVRELAKTLGQTGPRKDHPFLGVTACDLQPTDLQRLAQELRTAIASLGALNSTTTALMEKFGISAILTLRQVRKLHTVIELLRIAPKGLSEHGRVLLARASDSRFGAALKAGSDWKSARDAVASHFTDDAWTAPVQSLRAPISKGVGSFFSRILGKYRAASAELAAFLRDPLPKAPLDRLAMLDRLIAVQRKRELLGQEAPYLESALGDAWRGERTDFDQLISCKNWLAELAAAEITPSVEILAAVQVLAPQAAELARDLESKKASARNDLSAVLDRLGLEDASISEVDDLDLAQLHNRFVAMGQDIGRYSEWAKLANIIEALTKEGLANLVAAIDAGRIAPQAAVDEFLYATAEARWGYARAILPELSRLSQYDRHKIVAEFRDLDHARIRDVRVLVRAKHLEQLPKGAAGEMGFIRGEIAKKRGHKSVRKLIEAAGSMVRRIKPVFLMSPISIAQFLPPGSITFDMLVIDEASQVRPEDAFGAVARAKQIVVVGDQKQLPPTSFFDRLTDNVPEEEEIEGEEGVVPGTAKPTETESILLLCERQGLIPSMLEWHYRSRDPSLIRVSNVEFYEDRLILPPSPLQIDDNYGLKFTRVSGIYSSKSRGGGRPGTNRIEAEAVATALAAHARDWPEFSLGVVAFSKAQSDMLTDVLEVARRKDPVLDAYLRTGKNEDAFVKNIENVQGDERDVILISVGYGPHEANGRLSSMNFGPVNSDGGERRLNVLFSRARVRCVVFASFDPGDIDLTRATRSGPRILKRFLEFARSGQLEEYQISGLAADSPFEEDVRRVIASFGYPVDPQVGSAGFRIDLGVRNPEQTGQYILAVECDGAAWHRALWAKERDRMRQEVLEGLGWRFHRIWSTDWFHRRDQEIARLRAALEAAKNLATTGVKVAGTNRSDGALAVPPKEPEPPITEDEDLVVIRTSGLRAPAYQKANFPAQGELEPHEIPARDLAELVVKIVEIEGPIHVEEVARRIANGFGKARTGGRIQEVTNRALKYAKRRGELLSEGDFWLTKAQMADTPVRDRSAETLPTTKAVYLCPLEIRAGAALIEKESGAVEPTEMIRAVTRLLGYLRAGKDLQAQIAIALRKK